MKQSRIKKYGLQIAYVILLSACMPLLLVWFGLLMLLLCHFDGEHPVLLLVSAGLPVFLYWCAVVLLGIGNVVHAFRICKQDREAECVNSMLILKYGLVAFFCINFISLALWYAMLTLGMFAASRGMIFFALPWLLPWLIAGIALAAIGTWLAILPGSCYSIQVLRQAYRQGKLSGGAAVLHAVLQFFFLTDVLDAMYLAVKLYGRGKKSSLFIALLYVLVLAGMAMLFAAIMK